MITYEEFKQELINAMNELISDESKISSVKVGTADRTNMNGTDCITATFNDNSNSSPTIYIEEIYADYLDGYESIDDIAKKELDRIEKGHELFCHMDMNKFKSSIDMDAIYLQLINKERNPAIFDKCASIEIADLIAVPRYRVQLDEEQTGSILINREIQHKMMQMTDDELLSLARTNTLKQNHIIEDMGAMVNSLMGNDNPDQALASTGMYIITNEDMMYGATAILSHEVMDMLKTRMGEDYCYLIPSSEHEIIAIPGSTVNDPSELQAICQNVNDTCLDPKDYLGSNIYHYNLNTHKMNICNTIDDLINIEKVDQHQSIGRTQEIGRKAAI